MAVFPEQGKEFSILATFRSSFLISYDFLKKNVSVDSSLVCIECEIQNFESVCVCLCTQVCAF